MISKHKEAEVTRAIIFFILLSVIFVLLIADTRNINRNKITVSNKQPLSNRNYVRHYRHGRRSFGNKNINNKRNSANNQTVLKHNMYSKVRLQDIYNDKFFKNQVNWGLIIEEYQQNFPKEKAIIWNRVERRLKSYLTNRMAISKKTSIYFNELLKIKQDYFNFKQKYNIIASSKSFNSLRNNSVTRPLFNNKKVIKDTRISKSLKLSKLEQDKIKNLTRNYIPFSKILSDSKFIKVTGVSTIQFSKDTNWKKFDQKLINFMKNRLLNRIDFKKKENAILSRYEEIEYTYQYYLKNKSIKENVINIETLLPKKQFLINKNQGKLVNTTNTIKIMSKASYCNTECVGICQHNFQIYKDFVSCAKQACLCNEYDILKMDITVNEKKIGMNFLIFILLSVTIFFIINFSKDFIRKKTKIVNCEVNNRYYELLSNDDSIII